jgi:hypothetical protein
VARYPRQPITLRCDAFASSIRRRVRSAAAALALCPLLLPQCKAEFTGPFACVTGYASCINPQLNQCETDTQNDAAHCGACEKPCAVGAICSNGACGTAAQILSNFAAASAPRIAVNSTGVYWSLTGENQISRAPLNGGATSLVASNVSSCGSEVAFGLNDDAVYYWTSSFPCTGSPCVTSGMVSYAVGSGALAMLIPSSQTLSNGCPLAIAVNKSQLFWFDNQPNALVLLGAPLAKGTATTLATLPNGGTNGGLGLSNSMALFIAWQNGPSTLQQVPLGGGTPTPIPTELENEGGGVNEFVVDDVNVYVASGGCPCNGESKGTLPGGRIAKFALDGSGGTLLAEFDGMISSMAQDATQVYWATDTTLWKVPKVGGAAERVAGNLTNGAAPFVCTGDCAGPTSNPVAIAVGSSSAYIADGSPNVKAVLKVSK